MSRPFKITLLALAVVAVSLPIVLYRMGKPYYIGENILKAIKDDGDIRIDEKRPYSKYKDILDSFIQSFITDTFQQNDTGVLWVTLIRRIVRGKYVMYDLVFSFDREIEGSRCGFVDKEDVVRLKFHKKDGEWQLMSQKPLAITTLYE